MKSFTSPSLIRFLSDFTLGFSDGLTVPFALTAGLSSLGSTETIIYAGLAELCAGSISMGIGGYLAAKDEAPEHAEETCEDEVDEEKRGMLDGGRDSESSLGDDDDDDDEKSRDSDEKLVRRHLKPLNLPEAMISEIITKIQAQSGDLRHAALRLNSRNTKSSETSLAPKIWPVVSGLSILLGYAIGGTIPLLPYFIAATIGTALMWSIGLCLLTLFAFGSGKSWLLQGNDQSMVLRLRKCTWEGVQMLVLGSLAAGAAGAAVLCVRLLGGESGDSKG